MLTPELRKIIESYPLGFVASANEDGTPNLSPKGTFVILDDRHLAFGYIRSPQTLANLAARPVVEINFFDVLARKAARIRGEAHIFRKSEIGYGALFAAFATWGEYAKLISAIVRVRIISASLILSPAYDIGHTEDELRAQYKAKFAAL
jgi:hypothetical protein